MVAGAEKSMKLRIKSPGGILLEKEGVKSIQVDLIDGKIGIHPGHAYLIAEVVCGIAEIKSTNEIDRVPVNQGILVVKDDLVNLYTVGSELDVRESLESDLDGQDEHERLIASIFWALRPGAIPRELRYEE